MPTVPRTTTQVTAAGLPNARRTGAPNRQTLGAGIGEELAQVGTNLFYQERRRNQQIEAEERAKADEIAVLDARRQLSEYSNKALYDPQAGALTKRGSDAFEIIESTRAGLDAKAGELMAGLSNDEQRLAFQKIADQERDNVDGATHRHTAQERQRYDEDTTQAVLETSQSSAIANRQDPRRVGQDIRTMVETIEGFGKRNGVSPERTNQRVEAIISDTHAQVIDGLLADGNDKAAGVYFDEVKKAGQLSGPAITKLERALEEGTLRGESQRKADAIVAAGGTPAEQLAKVREIEDPKLRDATRERVEHEQAVNKRLQDEAHEARMVNAGNILDKTPDVTRIPISDWNAMTTGEKSALKQYAKNKLEGFEPQTDRATYYELAQQSADDPEGFGRRNLWTLRNKLADTEWKQVIGWQRDAKAGRVNKEAIGIRTNLQVAQDALKRAGIDPTPKDNDTAGAQALGRFYSELDKRVLKLQGETKKEATTADVEQIADDLLTEVVTSKGVGVWGAIWGQGPVNDQRARKFMTDPTNPAAGPRPVDQVQVPTADRAIITRLLTERGREPSEEAIRAYYLAAQAPQRQGSPSR